MAEKNLHKLQLESFRIELSKLLRRIRLARLKSGHFAKARSKRGLVMAYGVDRGG
jgi:hypothetical protein